MKTFAQYLTEADYKRFLKKNKNLSDDQKDEINTYFSKTNTQAGSTIDWQSKKVRGWNYDDFLDIMIQSKSGRKKIIKHQAIKGLKEGTDYVRVRMPTKEYLAYIPLNYETAQKFNTRELGVCSGPWCIGHSGDPYHWNDEVIENQQVPIYVVNRSSKWVVMIQEENRKYDVWTVENNPRLVKQGIPNFSVRKNLLSPKQRDMYDEIREEFYSEESEPEEIDIDDAVIDYDNLVMDINNAQTGWESAGENFYSECERIKEETANQYQEHIDDQIELHGELDSLFDSGEKIRDELDDERNEWIENDEKYDEPTTVFDGEHLTVSEIQNRLDSIEKRRDEAYEAIDNLTDEMNSIENIENYEMEDSDIDWTDNPPNEEDMYDDITIPSVFHGRYSDYIDLMEEHYGWSSAHSGGSADDDIRIFVMEGSWGNSSAEEVLSNNELYHPEIVNER